MQIKPVVKYTIIGVVILAIIIGIEGYYEYQKLYPATQDAYIQTKFVTVASFINGKIAQVNITNNQKVKKGQVLFTLDRTIYENTLHQAQAELSLTKQKLAAAKANIAAANSQLDKAKIELNLIQLETKRVLALVKNNDLSKSKADMANAKLKAAQSAYDAAKFKLQEAKLIAGKFAADNPAIKAAQAIYNNALYEFNHTSYHAPIAGIISNLKLHSGDLVAAGRPLFVIVNPSKVWVEANFTENKMTRLKVGLPVDIRLDIYPHKVFQGYIDSISASSGSAFSLLPKENTTGNWVKVSQRFPIIIKFRHYDPQKYPIRLGASCTVKVNTTAKS